MNSAGYIIPPVHLTCDLTTLTIDASETKLPSLRDLSRCFDFGKRACTGLMALANKQYCLQHYNRVKTQTQTGLTYLDTRSKLPSMHRLHWNMGPEHWPMSSQS